MEQCLEFDAGGSENWTWVIWKMAGQSETDPNNAQGNERLLFRRENKDSVRVRTGDPPSSLPLNKIRGSLYNTLT